MNYYKARMYSPQLGRFMQTDPIGYEDNVNLYGYVGNDPVNGVDPTGMYICSTCSGRSTDGTLDSGSPQLPSLKETGQTVEDTERTPIDGLRGAPKSLRVRERFRRNAQNDTDQANGEREFGVQVNVTKKEYVTRLIKGPLRKVDKDGKPQGAHVTPVKFPGKLIFFGHTHAALITPFSLSWVMTEHKGRPLTTKGAPSKEDVTAARFIRKHINKNARFEVYYRNFHFFGFEPGPWKSADFE